MHLIIPFQENRRQLKYLLSKKFLKNYPSHFWPLGKYDIGADVRCRECWLGGERSNSTQLWDNNLAERASLHGQSRTGPVKAELAALSLQGQPGQLARNETTILSYCGVSAEQRTRWLPAPSHN